MDTTVGIIHNEITPLKVAGGLQNCSVTLSLGEEDASLIRSPSRGAPTTWHDFDCIYATGHLAGQLQ